MNQEQNLFVKIDHNHFLQFDLEYPGRPPSMWSTGLREFRLPVRHFSLNINLCAQKLGFGIDVDAKDLGKLIHPKDLFERSLVGGIVEAQKVPHALHTLTPCPTESVSLMDPLLKRSISEHLSQLSLPASQSKNETYYKLLGISGGIQVRLAGAKPISDSEEYFDGTFFGGFGLQERKNVSPWWVDLDMPENQLSVLIDEIDRSQNAEVELRVAVECFQSSTEWTLYNDRADLFILKGARAFLTGVSVTRPLTSETTATE